MIGYATVRVDSWLSCEACRLVQLPTCGVTLRRRSSRVPECRAGWLKYSLVQPWKQGGMSEWLDSSVALECELFQD